MPEFSIPWGCWQGDDSFVLDFPDDWDVQICSMHDAPPLSKDEIRTACKQTIAMQPLSQLVTGLKTVAIAVDDLSRPTPADQVIPHVLEELFAGGIKPEDIIFVISLGSHTPLDTDDLAKKLGADIVAQYRVINHDSENGLIDTDIRVGKVPVKLNAAFMAADFKILLGSVVPHAFAGFSGGAKMVLPGLSNIESIEWTHKAVLMGLRGKAGTIKNNRFRQEFERVARLAGVNYVVQVVVNSQRKVAGVFCGELVLAHQEAAKFAAKVFATIPPKDVDVAILNAYPKDNELLQAENSLMFHHTASPDYLKPDGLIMITSACTLGMGHHGLFGPGKRLYRVPIRKGFLRERDLAAFVPGVTKDEFHTVYWEGYPYFRKWQKTKAFLKERYPNGARAAIVPCSSIQMAVSNES